MWIIEMPRIRQLDIKHSITHIWHCWKQGKCFQFWQMCYSFSKDFNPIIQLFDARSRLKLAFIVTVSEIYLGLLCINCGIVEEGPVCWRKILCECLDGIIEWISSFSLVTFKAGKYCSISFDTTDCEDFCPVTSDSTLCDALNMRMNRNSSSH